jgi:hypothetical protein
MKKLIALSLAIVCLAGCARYDVTLNNGSRLINMRRPALDKNTGIYTIKDAAGNKHRIPRSRISLIEPHVKQKVKGKKGFDDQYYINQ